MCFVMTEFLSRFCIVGQSVALSDSTNRDVDTRESISSNPSTFIMGASKLIRLLVFGKHVHSERDTQSTATLDYFCVNVLIADNTRASIEHVIRSATSSYGLQLLAEAPRPLSFIDDQSALNDLHIVLSECTTGWSLRSTDPMLASTNKSSSSATISSSSSSSSSVSRSQNHVIQFNDIWSKTGLQHVSGVSFNLQVSNARIFSSTIFQNTANYFLKILMIYTFSVLLASRSNGSWICFYSYCISKWIYGKQRELQHTG